MQPKAIQLLSPAKINLFLAVLPKRPDGFHQLVSLVNTLNFGDSIQFELLPNAQQDQLLLTPTSLPTPTDNNNLILKALAAYRNLYNFPQKIRITLDKKIPIGAGLGGGSSNAVTTLKALNQLIGNVPDADLKNLSQELGSDCMLFWNHGPSYIHGRGETIQPAPPTHSGKPILLFKPHFPINTTWAYKEFTKRPDAYINPQEAQQRMLSGEVFNSFETIVSHKYPALSVIKKQFKQTFNRNCTLSGSGSAFFILLEKDDDTQAIKTWLHNTLGESTFMVESHLL